MLPYMPRWDESLGHLAVPINFDPKNVSPKLRQLQIFLCRRRTIPLEPHAFSRGQIQYRHGPQEGGRELSHGTGVRIAIKTERR